MSKLYNIIKREFGVNVGFTIEDLASKCSIERVVLLKSLARMYDSFILTSSTSIIDKKTIYYLMDLELINSKIKEYNNTIDEYKLDLRKLKVFKE